MVYTRLPQVVTEQTLHPWARALTLSGMYVITSGGSAIGPSRCPGAAAAITIIPPFPDTGAALVSECGTFHRSTQSLRMETIAATGALIHVPPQAYVHMIIDNAEVVDAINVHLPKWRHDNWTTSQGAQVAHRDLWERLYTVLARRRSHLASHVYSHAKRGKCVANDYVDIMAGKLSSGQTLSFFQGPSRAHPAGTAVYQGQPLAPLHWYNEAALAFVGCRRTIQQGATSLLSLH